MKNIKPLDIGISIFALLIVFFSIFSLANKQTGSQVLIITEKAEYIYPLKKNAKISVSGTLGESIIIIDNEEVYFESSPCDNKLCVLSSHASQANDFIACLPNQVFLRIIAEKPDKNVFDSLGY